MKDPTTEILTALITALNGNLKYNSADYPVYTIVPKSVDYDYVLIDDIDFTDDSMKDRFDSSGTFLVDVVTADAQDNASMLAANSITNQIMNILVKQDLKMTNFTFSVTPFMDTTIPLRNQTNTAYILRKLTRFRFWVVEDLALPGVGYDYTKQAGQADQPESVLINSADSFSVGFLHTIAIRMKATFTGIGVPRVINGFGDSSGGAPGENFVITQAELITYNASGDTYSPAHDMTTYDTELIILVIRRNGAVVDVDIIRADDSIVSVGTKNDFNATHEHYIQNVAPDRESEHFDGVIRDIFIYNNVAVTNAQILANLKTGLMHRWEFNSIDKLVDQVAGKHFDNQNFVQGNYV